MTRRALLAIVAAIGAGQAAVATASADSRDRVACSPTPSWCVAVFHKTDKRIHFDVAVTKLTGRYQLCVTPPKRKETCRFFTLRRRSDGVFASSVLFTRNFPHAAHGRYRVRWLHQGRLIGRELSFRY